MTTQTYSGLRVCMVGLGLVVLACSDSPPPNGAAAAGGTGGLASGGTAGAAGATGGTAGASGAGGTTGGAGGGADAASDAGSVEQICAHLAAVTCQKFSQCLPYYVPANFGDIDTCVQQYVSTLCVNRVGIEDSGETAAAQEACAAARAAATCAEWYENDVAVAACLPQRGTRPTGAVCGTASQCQTINCEVAPGAACGTCSGLLVEAGGQCTSSSQCAGNLQCIGGVCGLPRGLGEPCSSHGACEYALNCVNGRCAVPAKAGESCTAVPCNSREGLTCVNGICEPFKFADPGERCMPGIVFCRRAGFCRPMPPPSVEGTCVAAALVGEACNHSSGPFCLPWSDCVGGVCKVADYASCK